MLALLFATEEEARPFLQRYARGRFTELAEGDAVRDDAVLVAVTGQGKIKATLRTERLLQKYRPDRLLHTGLATALNDDWEPGSLAGATEVLEGDRIELERPAYPHLPMTPSEGTALQGRLLTQDHTPTDDEAHAYWQRLADFSDMTGYAVAFVAATHGVPCQIAKVVTGTGEAEGTVHELRERAHAAVADFALARIEALAE